jgi:hypothetical protein
METSTAEAPVNKRDEALSIVRKVVCSYPKAVIEGLWCGPGTRGRGIRFTDHGMCRAVSIFSWLYGLVWADKRDMAAAYAMQIVNQLDQLANWGGTVANVADRFTVTAPATIVQLGDDGTPHGFSVAWFNAVPAEKATTDKNLKSDFDVKRQMAPDADHCYFWEKTYFRYYFNFHGGLLFHGEVDGYGSGSAPTYAVTLDRCDGWSIHT